MYNEEYPCVLHERRFQQSRIFPGEGSAGKIRVSGMTFL